MQTPFGLRFVPFPGLSHSGDQVFGERGSCNLLPPPSLLLGFLGVLLVHLLRCAVCLFWGADLWLDVDRPESQDVLVSNEACLQFGR